jgi:hypothetical protein
MPGPATNVYGSQPYAPYAPTMAPTVNPYPYASQQSLPPALYGSQTGMPPAPSMYGGGVYGSQPGYSAFSPYTSQVGGPPQQQPPAPQPQTGISDEHWQRIFRQVDNL